MKNSIASQSRISEKRTQLRVATLGKRIRQASDAGRYAEALQMCLQITRVAPDFAQPWIDAAICHIKLEQWDAAIGCAQEALKRRGNTLALFDALSHAWGARRNLDEARRWGRQALAMRAERFTTTPLLAHDTLTAPLPPPPSEATRACNLIAFSLFGASSKYCETAVLNAIEQPRIYPHWRCRFYVDETVPAGIVERLRGAAAEVIFVDASLKRRPGTMWRFAAYDTPQLHRVIFRDADSVISEREAGAVAEWIASGKHFHHMRDSPSHTELLLAGMWGVTACAMPPMQRLIECFLTRPMDSKHFADQYFLREFVWPYACQSLLQHDSIFGFMDARPFPGGPAPTDFHVGYAEGSPLFNATTPMPDGTVVYWELVASSPEGQPAICRYPAVVADGAIRANLPARYARKLERGELSIRVKTDVNG